MILELRIKKAALMAAIDIQIKRRTSSPERCARNLVELAFKTYPNHRQTISDNHMKELTDLCYHKDIKAIQQLIIRLFSIE